MPTLTELQRRQPLLSRPTSSPALSIGEEIVADSRATLTPSQLVDRKLADRKFSDLSRLTTSAIRPRAK